MPLLSVKQQKINCLKKEAIKNFFRATKKEFYSLLCKVERLFFLEKILTRISELFDLFAFI